MMFTKMTTLDFLKIKILWNKGYDVIIAGHDVINSILPRETYYTIDVLMWTKLGNSSTSVREVIITSTS